MHVFQCPRCDLKLPSAAELTDDLDSDHPDFHAWPTSVADALLSACHCRHHDGANHQATVHRSHAA